MSSNDIDSVRLTWGELRSELEAARDGKLNAREHPFAHQLGVFNSPQEFPDTIKPDPGLTRLANDVIHLGPVAFRPVLFTDLQADELERARAGFRDMASAHEGFAVLKEEVDELWDQVRLNQKVRDPADMLSELVQVAAMAQRMAEDIVFEGKLGE